MRAHHASAHGGLSANGEVDDLSCLGMLEKCRRLAR